MSPRMIALGVSIALSHLPPAQAALPAGDPDRGASAFRQCAACHSLEPDRHLTGPSLARIWGRRAGTAEGFARYSRPLKDARLVWNEQTLDAWLKDPQGLIPNNLMTVPGIDDTRERADLIAYLKAVSEGSRSQGGGSMMMKPTPDPKAAGRERQVSAIRYCGDTYHITTVTGETIPFWEFNLRFKTDSSRDGPAKGKPVLIRAGMMGDRAFLVFASPEEISAMIDRKC